MNLDELWQQQFSTDFPECRLEEQAGMSREDLKFMKFVKKVFFQQELKKKCKKKSFKDEKKLKSQQKPSPSTAAQKGPRCKQNKCKSHRVQQGGDGGEGSCGQSAEEAEREGPDNATAGEKLQTAAEPPRGSRSKTEPAEGEGRGQGQINGEQDEVDQRALQGRRTKNQRRRGQAALLVKGVGRSKREYHGEDAETAGQETEEHPTSVTSLPQY